MPKLSFVIPAHNEEHELPAALQALRAAAEGSGESYELIVVDDASSDATAEIARRFGAHVLTVNRRQIAAVRNAGARIVRGEILFFVDADTRIAPAHVRSAIAAIAQGCVGGGARVALDMRVAFSARLCLAAFSLVYFGLGLGAGAFLFCRRESFEDVGGFDEQYFAGEELYLSLALKKIGRFKILREPVITSARKMRMHSSGTLLRQSLFIILRGKRGLRKREKLALWYDGKRERRAA
ncbi:MAG TPA: glycosyltransferase [Chthoniobacterales bacterium]|jgi:glycosyltransferase involved in cell wall biosynthesis